MGLIQFCAHGTTRAGNTATLNTDRTFTGQKQDGTGLLYYNARYYDPALGTFISPDTLVPDPGLVLDYNRYMYVRGNPLRYTDPSGHEPCTTDFCWRNRWYNARGYFWDSTTSHWSKSGMPMFADDDILADVLHEAGIAFDAASPWQSSHLDAIGRGVWALSQKLTGGLRRVSQLLGPGARMYLSPGPCPAGAPACALPWEPVDGRYPVKFDSNQIGNFSVQWLTHTTVHELAHVIDWNSGGQFSSNWNERPLTNYAACTFPNCVPAWERWAEAVTYFVFGEAYAPRGAQSRDLGAALNPDVANRQRGLVDALLNP
jgi:RHS repeat-associated protein